MLNLKNLGDVTLSITVHGPAKRALIEYFEALIRSRLREFGDPDDPALFSQEAITDRAWTLADEFIAHVTEQMEAALDIALIGADRQSPADCFRSYSMEQLQEFEQDFLTDPLKWPSFLREVSGYPDNLAGVPTRSGSAIH